MCFTALVLVFLTSPLPVPPPAFLLEEEEGADKGEVKLRLLDVLWVLLRVAELPIATAAPGPPVRIDLLVAAVVGVVLPFTLAATADPPPPLWLLLLLLLLLLLPFALFFPLHLLLALMILAEEDKGCLDVDNGDGEDNGEGGIKEEKKDGW